MSDSRIARPTPKGAAPGALLRAVTFDCWGTLLFERDPERAHVQRVAAVARLAQEKGHGVGVGEARHALDAAWRRHWDAWLAQRATGAAEIAAWTLEGLGFAEDERTGLVSPLTTALAEASLEGDARALEGARDTLEGLARAGIRRALVCDTGFSPGRVVRQLLDRAGLLEWLEVQIFSDEAGVPKPHPHIFEQALKGIAAAPSEALHVGDLRRTDIAGARDLGMRTVRIRDHYDDQSEHPDADHVVDSHAHLQQLLGIVGRLSG